MTNINQHLAGKRRLGTPGYLSCLVFSLIVAVLAQGWRASIACGLSVTLAAVFYPAGLEPLRSRRLWLFVAFLLVPAALLAAPKDLAVGGVSLSRHGLVAGIQMAFRAVTILIAVSGFAASVSVSELSGLLERAGLRGLGFALGVAFNMLPVVRETAANAYQALRLRGGFQRQRLRTLRLLLVTVVVNSLRHADDIVNAAEARAFSPDRARPLPVTRERSDLALAGVLVLLALALL
ncbi:MAG: Energy-coupling factor transporter transmembrane protein EcfT [Anaerolineales bacterium]|nr:Energy-coupling factor transporter transmembrane protein EcfT [Anaerolineales bacterium]